jgi:O-antigen/teichoic acid export membrane protein
MSKGKHIFTSALAGYLRFFVSSAILWFLTPYIIKHVGIDDFGLWTLVFSVIGIYELLDLGFVNGVIKYVAKYDALKDYTQRNLLLSTILFVYCLMAVIGMIGVIFLSFFFNEIFSIPPSQSYKAIALLLLIGVRTLLLGLPASLFRGILYGEKCIALTNSIMTVTSIIYGLSVYFAMEWGYSIISLAVLTLATFCIEGLSYFIFSFRLVPELRLSWSQVDLSKLRELASFCLMQCVANISSQLINRTDPIIIKLFMSIFYVSIYSIPLRIVTYTYMFINQFTDVLSPYIAHFHATSEHLEIRSLYLESSKYVLAFATLFFITGALLADPFIVLWLGDQFAQSVPPMIILVTAMWFNCTYIVAAQVLAMSGLHALLTRYFFVTAIAHLILSVALIYPFGINGVAIGTLLTAVMGFFVNNKWVCDHFNTTYKDYFLQVILPLVIPSVALALAIYAMKLYIAPKSLFMLLLTSLPGAAIFAILIWTMGLNATERENFRKILKSTLKRA